MDSRRSLAVLSLSTALSISALGAPAHAETSEADRFGKPLEAMRIHRAERPQSVKPFFRSHKVQVNPGFINPGKDQFTPVTGQTYEWVINEDNELIIGVEFLQQDSEAFIDGATEVAGKNARRKFGHPTLAVRFRGDGEAVEGPARISGTLYEVGDTWTIDDRSGRYCLLRTDEDHGILLDNAVELFHDCGLEVASKLFTPEEPTHQLHGASGKFMNAVSPFCRWVRR